jgi:hypothetical protein
MGPKRPNEPVMGHNGPNFSGASPPLIVEFGGCLRSIRQRLGYAVASLASGSGFPGEYIEAVEVGHAELSIRSLAVLCEALGLCSAILFRKNGNPSG